MGLIMVISQCPLILQVLWAEIKGGASWRDDLQSEIPALGSPRMTSVASRRSCCTAFSACPNSRAPRGLEVDVGYSLQPARPSEK